MKKSIARLLADIYRKVLEISQKSYRNGPLSIKKSKARVISVGNITWGGTGKTPLVAKLAGDLSASGKKVAILTRGYGKDEVEELKKKLPHVPLLVGRDRIKTAREAVEKHGSEILILDDGFQHIRLHRDLDILTINSTEPFGPGGLIPVGTLREPMENIARADLFILTKSDIGAKNVHWITQKIHEIKPTAVIFEAVHKPLHFWDPVLNKAVGFHDFRVKKVASLSGLADPHSFEKTVENIGIEIVFAGRFDDHHDYSRSEIDEFLKRSEAVGAMDIVTTRKDFERLAPFFERGLPANWKRFQFWVLEIEFQLNDEDEFLRRCVNS